MILYLAGPMTGLPEFNFPAFIDAAKILREQGHCVFSPAERDLAIGFDPTKNSLEGFDLVDAMRWDLGCILHQVQGVALLPGWEASKGVSIELTVARAVDRKIFLYVDGELRDSD